jgi:hypothetical protein
MPLASGTALLRWGIAPRMRDLEVIDSELRLLLAIRPS